MPSFFSGVARILDIGCTYDHYRNFKSPEEADAAAEEKGAILKTAIKWINVFDDRLEIEWKRIYAELMRGGVIEVSDAPAARVPTRPGMGGQREEVLTINKIIDLLIAA